MGPLDGRRVALTRPAESTDSLRRKLEGMGALVLLTPAIRRAPPTSWGPLDRGIAGVFSGRYAGVLFTSPASVEPFWLRLRSAGGGNASLNGVVIGAVGQGTAAALGRLGICVDVVPGAEYGSALAIAVGSFLGERIRGARFLQPRAEEGREELRGGLESRGAVVEVVAAYRTLRASPAELEPLVANLRAGAVDAVVFASPSAVEAVLAAASSGLGRARAVAIGETTAAALEKAGIDDVWVASRADDEGMASAVVDALRTL
ncbi:uroporphyrinogen-III synthase [Vulgatibacter incomptus]|uniref:Uroporphyrinogen-III synthase n=1 Tax=Vulgatibacter incomptus TaxID=1391653 RepID=A0A0K1PCF7_9BACT|nr:uroporphyrinogen-III synthase [Vulgatibacter incomptus]AKU91197.1 Uroporphyrinogen-III synthase [Vulgatibacter incomptus]